MEIVKTKDKSTCTLLNKLIFPNQPWSISHDEALWLVKDGDGVAVGFAACKPVSGEDGVLYLTRAGLLEEFRGKGIQKKLIEKRLEWGRKSNYNLSITYTSRFNAPSFANLQKCGFKLYIPDNRWAGKKMLYWRKKLNSNNNKRK